MGRAATALVLAALCARLAAARLAAPADKPTGYTTGAFCGVRKGRGPSLRYLRRQRLPAGRWVPQSGRRTLPLLPSGTAIVSSADLADGSFLR